MKLREYRDNEEKGVLVVEPEYPYEVEPEPEPEVPKIIREQDPQCRVHQVRLSSAFRFNYGQPVSNDTAWVTSFTTSGASVRVPTAGLVDSQGKPFPPGETLSGGDS